MQKGLDKMNIHLLKLISVTFGMGGREGGSRGRWYVYTYGWFVLLYVRNKHNIVNNFPPIKNWIMFWVGETYPAYQPVGPKQYPYNNLYLERGGDPNKEPETVVHYEIWGDFVSFVFPNWLLQLEKFNFNETPNKT